eukprot:UC4_evm6s1456
MDPSRFHHYDENHPLLALATAAVAPGMSPTPKPNSASSGPHNAALHPPHPSTNPDDRLRETKYTNTLPFHEHLTEDHINSLSGALGLLADAAGVGDPNVPYVNPWNNNDDIIQTHDQTDFTAVDEYTLKKHRKKTITKRSRVKVENERKERVGKRPRLSSPATEKKHRSKAMAKIESKKTDTLLAPLWQMCKVLGVPGSFQRASIIWQQSFTFLSPAQRTESLVSWIACTVYLAGNNRFKRGIVRPDGSYIEDSLNLNHLLRHIKMSALQFFLKLLEFSELLGDTDSSCVSASNTARESDGTWIDLDRAMVCPYFDAMAQARYYSFRFVDPVIRTFAKQGVLRLPPNPKSAPSIFPSNMTNVEQLWISLNSFYESAMSSHGDADERPILNGNVRPCAVLMTKSDFCAKKKIGKQGWRQLVPSALLQLPQQESAYGIANLKNILLDVEVKNPNILPSSLNEYLKLCHVGDNHINGIKNLMQQQHKLLCEFLSGGTINLPINTVEKITNATIMISYCFLEKILRKEEKKIDPKNDGSRSYRKQKEKLDKLSKFQNIEKDQDVEEKKRWSHVLKYMVSKAEFITSLIACGFEIALFCFPQTKALLLKTSNKKYNGSSVDALDFPFVLRALSLSPFDFQKVVELVIRVEDGLSRDMIRHLSECELSVIDCLAWESSELFADLQLPSEKWTLASKIFFRRVHMVAASRLMDLCCKLCIQDRVQRQISRLMFWVLSSANDLIRGRHIDQILLCCIYVITHAHGISFRDIILCYRTQSQARYEICFRVTLDRNGVLGSLIEFYNQCFVPRVNPMIKNILKHESGDRQISTHFPLLSDGHSVSGGQSPLNRRYANTNLTVSLIS